MKRWTAAGRPTEASPRPIDRSITLRQLAAAAFILLVLPVAASAQQYPPASGNLTVDKTAVAPGGSVRVSSDQCIPGSTVSLQVDSASAGTTTAGSAGSFTTSVTLPTSAAAGVHTITAECPRAGGGTRVLSANVDVSRGLPRTGATRVALSIIVGLGLVTVGGAFVAGVRRRRAAQTTT
jgi:LPXTG-motif cell wall-anchored protein